MLDRSTVQAIVRTSFEEMAFLDVQGFPDGKPAPVLEDGPVLHLSYSHPVAGDFLLFLPKEVKFRVGEAIYGESWNELTSSQLDDSLLELMNVLAGSLLTARFGAEAPYTMGLPSVLFESPDFGPGIHQRTFSFLAEEIPFQLVWSEPSTP